MNAVVTLKAEHSPTDLLAAARLARSTFFYHQHRLDAPDPYAALKTAVTEVFTANKARYGYRRVHGVLTKNGWRVNRKTVLKLMRLLGLASTSRRKRRYVSYQGEVGQIAENILDRDFTAETMNEKWVTDVTEFRVGDEKLYLSPVMDLCNREIIAYSTSRSPNLQLTNRSLADAIKTLAPGQHPLVHSDQGSSISIAPGGRCSPPPAQRSQCPARATASTTRSWRASSATSRKSASTTSATSASTPSKPRCTSTSAGITTTGSPNGSRA